MEETTQVTDIGDYLKLFACTAVMLQTILMFVLTTIPSATNQIGIGMTYNLIKFTAPAFIFGILYTTARKTIATPITYRHYLKQQWHSLFIPTILWTTIYLFITPELQQGHHYHNISSLIWQFINGNAAPHLWYNTMMLQFILLMPLMWLIGRWCGSNSRRGSLTAIVSIAGYLLWISFYDTEVFHGPHMMNWYLLDRLFLSFFIYGVLGVLAWQYRKTVDRFFRAWWPIVCLIFLGSFYWTNHELFEFGFPVKLTNAPYYKPSMILYDLSVISLISTLGIFQIDNHSTINKVIHILAEFAYKAFLSNVFWSYLLWYVFGKNLVINHLLIGALVLYTGTWLLSFGSAFAIHLCWQKFCLYTRSYNPRTIN